MYIRGKEGEGGGVFVYVTHLIADEEGEIVQGSCRKSCGFIHHLFR